MYNFRIRTEYLMHSKQLFNSYATIVMPSVLHFEYEWYMSIFLTAGHLVVPDVLCRTRSASRSGHYIAGSGLQTDLPLEELPRPALHAGLQAMWRCRHMPAGHILFPKSICQHMTVICFTGRPRSLARYMAVYDRHMTVYDGK
jgi:hypothetical protein